jgi:hypothetical protein
MTVQIRVSTWSKVVLDVQKGCGIERNAADESRIFHRPRAATTLSSRSLHRYQFVMCSKLRDGQCSDTKFVASIHPLLR